MKFLLPLLFTLFTACALTTSPPEKISLAEKITPLFVKKLLSSDTKATHDMFNDNLKQKIDLNALNKIQTDLIKEHGELSSISQSFFRKNEAHFIIKMELSTIVLNIFVDTNQKISGFWQRYVEDRSERKKLIMLPSFDGFKIPIKITIPDEASNEDVKSVIIFIHGSGPNDYNGTDQKLFHHLAKGMNENGIATVRYNKRSYELVRHQAFDPRYRSSKDYRKFGPSPYRHFIQDANQLVKHARALFPRAKFILLGHSQGAGIALQVAHVNRMVAGVVLVGFTTTPIYVSAFEQTLYRHMDSFYRLDQNRDNLLTTNELAADNVIASQMTAIDLNHDKKLSRQEFKGAQFVNFIFDQDSTINRLTIESLRLPSPVKILKRSKFKVVFFQGEMDHQTQSYHTKAIQNANNLKWKKSNFKFVYLPNLGHALNHQDKFIEFDYQKVEQSTINRLVQELKFITD